MEKKLAELAELADARVQGDKDCLITGIATLAEAQQGELSFFHNPKYQQQLKNTQASAVILHPDATEHFYGNALITESPYFAYARLAKLFAYQKTITPGVHPTAVIGDNCDIDETASIGPYTVIEDNVKIGADTVIGAHCSIGEGSQIGRHCSLDVRVNLYHHVQLQDRVVLYSGVVVGSDGFGNAMHEGKWYKVPQLGAVVIESDVEVGANTTIDRGALGNTHIKQGVRLDNQIQVGHNVVIGEYTAVAACAGMAGSATVGRYCMIGGGARINGHIEIADQTVITGMAMVTNSIKQAGMYSSGTGLMETRTWRKNIARLRQLDKLIRQIKRCL